VLALLRDGPDEIQARRDVMGFFDLVRGPFGGGPVECPALVDDEVEGPDGLFNGCGGVGAVGEEDVDVCVGVLVFGTSV
jgi:hypothetical protein